MSKPSLIKKDLKSINNFTITFNKILDALAEYKGHYDKKFNLSKMFELLDFSKAESNQIIELILKIQNIFKTIFNEYELEKETINNVIYFVAKKNIPTTIEINRQDVDIINDMVYMFKYVERGKGFNLDNKNTKLLEKIKKLYIDYPYFFQKNGNNLFYPSQITQKLGDLIFSYKKNNKMIEELQIENYKIRIKNDGS